MITQDYLKTILNYDKETGEWTWKIKKGTRALVGNKAGTLDNTGYIHIAIDRKVYQSHRLVWLYIYGKFPAEFLDHINNIKHDNSLKNLRECTRQQNGINRGNQSNNTTGFKGVCWKESLKKYTVRCTYQGKRVHLGCFTLLEDAAKAYEIFSRKHHKGFHYDN